MSSLLKKIDMVLFCKSKKLPIQKWGLTLMYETEEISKNRSSSWESNSSRVNYFYKIMD